MKNSVLNIIILLITINVIFIGCSPCFNTMQTARVLKPKTIEITPNYTCYGEFDEDSWKQYSYGGRLGIGITPKISLYGYYGRVEFGQENDKEYWDNFNIVGMGLKIKMTKPEDNKTLAALYVPIGTYYKRISDRIEYIQIQPTMLLTRPIIKRLDLLSSSLLVISKVKGSEINIFIAQNIGIDINLNNKGLSIRPEIGYGIGEGGIPIYQYSIGFSYAPSGYAK